MFRYVSRYVLYRDLCIEIRIVSWGTCIVTPLTRGCPYDNLRCSLWWHYNDVIMDAMASQITSLPIINSTVYSRLRSKEHQSSASLAFVWGIHHWLVSSPHKGPVTWQMFPFDDVIMEIFVDMMMTFPFQCFHRKSYHIETSTKWPKFCWQQLP